MSDLSRLLGDVYRSGPAAPAAEETETNADPEAPEDAEGAPTTLSGALPEWADESVLDEAFANWVPGPPVDAPLTERGMLADLAAPPAREAGTASAPVETRPTTLADAVPSAPDFMFPDPDGEATAMATISSGQWQRSDDDLLPPKGRGRGRRRK